MLTYIASLIFLPIMSVSVNGLGYGVPVVGKLVKDEAHGIKANLHNKDNVVYTGKIYVGTPISGEKRQEFTVILDTGSVDLILNNSNYRKICNSRDPLTQAECKRAEPNVYTASKSLSHEPTSGTFSTAYLGGNAYSGHLIFEYLEIGDGPSKIRVKAQIGMADSSTNGVSTDGIFGMAFGISSDFEPHILSAFESIFAQTDIPGQIGYYIRRDPETKVDRDYEGEIYFGGYNSEYVTSPFTQPVPITPTNGFASCWYIALKSIMVGANEIKLENRDLDNDGVLGTNALPDTGSSTIVMHENILQYVISYLFPSGVPEGVAQDYAFLCDELPTDLPDIIFVTYNDVSFTIGPEYYIAVMANGLLCKFDITPCKCKNLILGNNFIQKYYTVFDFENRQFLFAESKQEPITAERRQPGKHGKQVVKKYTREEVNAMRRDAPTGQIRIPQLR